MRIIRGSSGNNRIVQEAVQNRIGLEHISHILMITIILVHANVEYCLISVILGAPEAWYGCHCKTIERHLSLASS